MKKYRFSFIFQLLLIASMGLGYTRCQCTPSVPLDASQPSSSSPSNTNTNTNTNTNANTNPQPTITQEMINKAKDNNAPQFLVDRLEELRRDDKSKINLVDNSCDNYTALHHVTYRENLEIIAALLEEGADPTLKESSEGQTPFYLAIDYAKRTFTPSWVQVIRTFLKARNVKVFIDIPDARGIKPLANVTQEIDALRLVDQNDPKIAGWEKIKEEMEKAGATK